MNLSGKLDSWDCEVVWKRKSRFMELTPGLTSKAPWWNKKLAISITTILRPLREQTLRHSMYFHNHH